MYLIIYEIRKKDISVLLYISYSSKLDENELLEVYAQIVENWKAFLNITFGLKKVKKWLKIYRSYYSPLLLLSIDDKKQNLKLITKIKAAGYGDIWRQL